jgi:hypothetical protein
MRIVSMPMTAITAPTTSSLRSSERESQKEGEAGSGGGGGGEAFPFGGDAFPFPLPGAGLDDFPPGFDPALGF